MKSLYAMIIAAVMALPMSIAHAATKDIVDTAAGAGKFETLIAAAKAAPRVVKQAEPENLAASRANGAAS